MCVYHKYREESQQQSAAGEQIERPPPVVIDEADVATPVKIENKLAKMFKSHRCVLDFGHSFCKATFTETLAGCGSSRVVSKIMILLLL